MISLLKTFGKGILYVIGMPFFILALVLFAVIGIFLFLFQIIRSVIYFFTGQKFFPELEEDKQLRLLKEKAAGLNSEEEEQVEEMPSLSSEDSIIMPLPPVVQKQPEPVEEQHSPIEEACFVEPEELMAEEKEEDNEDEDVLMQSLVREQLAQEEAKVEEPIEEPFVEMKEETLETSEPKEEEPFVEEELEEYVPKSSSYFEEYEDEEDTNDNGVDIDYDVR